MSTTRSVPSDDLGHVLVVDDDEDVRLLCEINLTLAGYSITELDGAESLLTTARSCRPDAILLDLAMVQGSGWDCLATLRADPGLRDVPVAIMSASDSNEIRSRGNAAGVSLFLTKPFHPSALVEAVEELIGAYRAEARSAG